MAMTTSNSTSVKPCRCFPTGLEPARTICSPREKEEKTRMTKRCRGGSAHRNQPANNRTQLNGSVRCRSRMDHESKQGGSLPPPFRPPLVRKPPAQAGVRATSSTALAPPHRLVLRVARGNESAAKLIFPAGAGRLTVRSGKTDPTQPTEHRSKATPPPKRVPRRWVRRPKSPESLGF